MKGKNERLDILLVKYLDNRLTVAEQEEFSIYVEDPDYASQLKSLLGEAFLAQYESDPLTDVRRKRVLDNVFAAEVVGRKERYRLFRFNRVAVAAIFICLITIAFLVIPQLRKGSDTATTLSGHDIRPGGDGATLTLADGRKIPIDSASTGALLEEEGIRIVKSANGEMTYELLNSGGIDESTHVLSTAKGQTYRVRLADGSIVYLNAGSSLTYTKNLLVEGKRRVKLTGEAFFEVEKDADHPFVVESANQEIVVLGTRFNVSAYQEDNKLVTTLVEGAVQIEYEGKRMLLSPGQQALALAGQLTASEVDVSKTVDWTKGYFRFQDLSVAEIMIQLNRWYDMEVEYSDEISKERVSGKISRHKPISDVLRMIENTGIARFKIQGRRVIVTK